MADFNVLLEPIKDETSTPGQVLSGELSWLRHLVVPETATPQSSGQLQYKSVPPAQQPVEPEPIKEPEPLLINTVELGDQPHTSDNLVHNPAHPSSTEPKLKTKPGEKLFACDQCDYRAGRSSHLKEHLSTVHATEKPFACDQCPYKAAIGSFLKQHKKTHADVRPHACDECDFKAKRASHLRQHKLLHAGLRPFGCDQCDYKSSSRHRLKQHVAKHTGEKPYACGECDYRSVTPAQLKQHKMHHTGEKPFACDECEYKTTTSYLLRIHKMGHSGEKPFACDECDFKTITLQILRRHKLAHSGEEKVSICDQCGFKCFTSSYLTIHMRKHTGEKPYACDQCSHRFSDACNLRRHKKIHSGERPFACDLCEFRSSRPHALKIHKRALHGGEKPFACEECDFRSAWNVSLTAHKKIHLKELQDKEGKKRKQKQQTKKVKKTKTAEKESSSDVEDDLWDNADMPSSDEGDAELCQTPEDLDKDKQFTTPDELLAKIHDFIQKEVLLTEVRDDKLFIFKLDTNPYLRVKYSLTINKDLDVTVVYSSAELNEISGYKFPFRSSNIVQIQAILSRLDGMAGGSDASVVEKTTVINNLLSSIASDDNENQIRFLKEQIELTTQSKNDRYSPETMAFFSILYTLSPLSYKYFRRSQYLKMPRSAEMERLSSNRQCDEQQSFLKEVGLNGFNYEPNLKHARNVYRHTTERDRTVVILMDQISIKPFCDFKNGEMIDLAQDSKELVTTVHTFVISSIGSTFKELVHIMPVRSFTAEKMHNVLKNLIVGLEKVGFRVVGIVSDNQSLSREAVSHFSSPPLLSIAYLHPCDKHRPLFYVIDPAHITKSIRNHWIDSKQQQTIVYPKFHPENDSDSLKATFSDIKLLFENQSISPDKHRSPLTWKALYPSNIDRENMKLVLQVFNTAVIEGLNSLNENSIRDCSGSSEFIKIVVEFCKVLDITSPSKAQIGDDLQKLVKLKSVSSEIKILDDMLIWLDKWEQLDVKNDSLLTETISILKHSSYAIAEIVQYCIDELKIEYFLPKKLQVDAMERQFGQYRMLRGSLFHVSLPQLCQDEKKFGLRNFCLIVKTKINVHLRKIGDTEHDVEEGDCPSTTNLYIDVDDSDLRNVENIIPILVYIGGYCSEKMASQCTSCKSVFVQNASLAESNSCSLINALSRGGLNVPQDFCLTVTVYCYIVFTKILNNNHLKTEFLKMDNQRNVLLRVILDALYADDILEIIDCTEGHSVLDTTKKFVWTTCNTLMNIFRWAPNKIAKEPSSKVNYSSCSVNKVSNIAKSSCTDKRRKLKIVRIKNKTNKNIKVRNTNQKTHPNRKKKISKSSKVSKRKNRRKT